MTLLTQTGPVSKFTKPWLGHLVAWIWLVYSIFRRWLDKPSSRNNRVSGERTIGAVTLTLIKVADARLGSTEEIRTADGLTMVYGSMTRTLVDAVYDWARFNSLPRAYAWIRRELAARRITAADLIRVTLRYGDKGTFRRIGFLLEREGVASSLLAKLARALPASTSLIPWDPAAPKRGTVNRRWGVAINEPA